MNKSKSKQFMAGILLAAAAGWTAPSYALCGCSAVFSDFDVDGKTDIL